MISSPHIKDKISMPHIELVNTIVPISTVARNIGVFFDDALSIRSHVQHVCRVAYYHLHHIGRFRNLLNQKNTEMMVHVYVISRLDNGNGLLYGSSDHLLGRTRNDSTFSHAASRLWNNPRLAVRAAGCHNSSKKQLNTLLFKSAFSL